MNSDNHTFTDKEQDGSDAVLNETRKKLGQYRVHASRHDLQGNSIKTEERDKNETQERVKLFHASLRRHGFQHYSDSPVLPMTVSIHDLPQPAPGNKRFIRNVILATTLLAAGIISVNSLKHPLEVACPLGSQEAPSSPTNTLEKHSLLDATEKPRLQSTSFVLGNDLSTFSATDIRKSLKYVNVVFRGEERKTLDVPSRLLLSKWASDSNGLNEVGLNWKVLYGFIHAESTWVPQEGIGRNGVKSHGLAQFEVATAKGYGLRNAYDSTAAVSAAAALIKDAAYWTQSRLTDLKISKINPAKSAQALREGVSVYYNTGWKTRHAWTPAGSGKLPEATKTHIINVKAGNMIADSLVADIKAGNKVSTPSAEMQNDAVRRAEEMISMLRLTKATETPPLYKAVRQSP